jgi:hypothetical protein
MLLVMVWQKRSSDAEEHFAGWVLILSAQSADSEVTRKIC